MEKNSKYFLIKDQIVYEDNHIIVINKLPSEIVQGDKTGDIPLSEKIKSFIKNRDYKPGNVFCGVVHRLDRPVSGLIIFAKTSKALTKFNELIREKNIEKKYLAVVKNKPGKNSDRLIHFLTKNENKNLAVAHASEIRNSQRAELDYEFILSSDNYHLLKISLLTGRHHQIRCQLAAIGCPIKGDIKYGFDRTNKSGFIHLHSYFLSFIHPIKKEKIELKCFPKTDDPVWNYFVKSLPVEI